MDIAEIRKKAKAGQKQEAESVGQPQESALHADESVQLSVEESLPDTMDLEESAEPLDEVPEESASATALDRLFGGEGTFELATEEAYQDALALKDAEEFTDVRQFLSFQLGQEEYALDITQISEIIKVREFTDIPRVPDFILGIISLRGVVVPVFDLKKRFRLGQANLTPASRIVVCQLGELIAGLLVDKINQVININDNRIEPPPAVLSGLDRDLVEGVGRFQGRMIIILHLHSVLDAELI